MSWTAEDMDDLGGETVIVTGANSGLGFSATRELARHGAQVVMACRNLEKADDARQEIEDEVENADLDVIKLDLADLESVSSFAENFRDKYDSLDVLCNNAGLMAIPRRETQDGFEMQFGVNHLGHFALTGHLIDMIQESGGRVVNQSSMAHEGGEIDFDDLMGEDDYSKWGAYGQSKLANLLFTYELDRRLEDADSEAMSIGCHPGVSDTNLFRKGPEMTGSRVKLLVGEVFTRILGQSPDKGCLPMLYAASTDSLEGGEYIGPDGFREMRGYPEKQDSTDESHNKEDAQRLWQVSEELTGVSFNLD